MSAERNAAAARKWFEEGWNQGKVELVDELYSPQYVTHSLGPDLPPTAEGLKMFVRAFREGMPDLHFEIERVIAQGDFVATQMTGSGTHLGTLFGIPPTGRKGNTGVIVIARFDDDGKWVEDWAQWDQLGMLRQLGVIPEPVAA